MVFREDRHDEIIDASSSRGRRSTSRRRCRARLQDGSASPDHPAMAPRRVLLSIRASDRPAGRGRLVTRALPLD